MKTLRIMALLAGVLALSACTKVVPVQQNEVAFEIDSDGTWQNTLIRGENAMINDLCDRHCDDIHIFEAHNAIIPIVGEYAMPQSNDTDLTLELDVKVTLDLSGGTDVVRKRLMETASTHKYLVEGDLREPQVFRTPIGFISRVDLNPAAVKSRIRTILEPYEITEAYYNISKNGKIFDDMRNAIADHLVSINSPLKVLEVQVKRIAQPIELVNKNKREAGLISDDRIQRQELKMKERRMARMQAIRLKETLNDLEIIALQEKFLTPRVQVYLWQQTANRFAEAGIPFATHPSMLAPALEKTTNQSVDNSRALEALRKRVAEIDNQIKAETECDAKPQTDPCHADTN